jgi:hypothetical protein
MVAIRERRRLAAAGAGRRPWERGRLARSFLDPKKESGRDARVPRKKGWPPYNPDPGMKQRMFCNGSSHRIGRPALLGPVMTASPGTSVHTPLTGTQ